MRRSRANLPRSRKDLRRSRADLRRSRTDWGGSIFGLGRLYFGSGRLYVGLGRVYFDLYTAKFESSSNCNFFRCTLFIIFIKHGFIFITDFKIKDVVRCRYNLARLFQATRPTLQMEGGQSDVVLCPYNLARPLPCLCGAHRFFLCVQSTNHMPINMDSKNPCWNPSTLFATLSLYTRCTERCESRHLKSRPEELLPNTRKIETIGPRSRHIHKITWKMQANGALNRLNPTRSGTLRLGIFQHC